MNPIITICAIISLSGILCGHAFAEVTHEGLMDLGKDISKAIDANNKLLYVSQTCNTRMSAYDESVVEACAAFYKAYSKNLQDVVNESSTDISTITGMTPVGNTIGDTISDTISDTIGRPQ